MFVFVSDNDDVTLEQVEGFDIESFQRSSNVTARTSV